MTVGSRQETPRWWRRAGWRPWVAPLGAAAAAVSFFLPWGRFSFLFVHRSASGHTIGGWGWVIFVLAMIAALAGLILPRWRRKAPARELVFGAALLGLLLFAVESNQLAHGVWTPFGRIQPQDIGVKPGAGAFGTILGYVTAIIGAFLMPGPVPRWVRPRLKVRHPRLPESAEAKAKAEGAANEAEVA